MNILERFPIDTIRRFVANRLGVNPSELSMDYRCLSLDSQSIPASGLRVIGSKARCIVPIAFTFSSTGVSVDRQLEVKLQLENHTCGVMACFSELLTLVNVAVERSALADPLTYENLCNPFGSSNVKPLLFENSSCFYSVLSDFCIFEGQLTPSINLTASTPAEVALSHCKFEYLEFGLS